MNILLILLAFSFLCHAIDKSSKHMNKKRQLLPLDVVLILMDTYEGEYEMCEALILEPGINGFARVLIDGHEHLVPEIELIRD